MMWETDFYPVPVLRGIALFPPAQYWIKIVHPWLQKSYLVLGLGSGERLLGHIASTALDQFTVCGDCHDFHNLDGTFLLRVVGSQHPSPNVKTLCNFEPQIWPEMITSRDSESTFFEGSRTSCDMISFGIFLASKDHST